MKHCELKKAPKDIYFWGIPIIKVKRTLLSEKRYFLGIPYRRHKWSMEQIDQRFVETLFPQIDPAVKTVYVIRTNTGETNLFARTFTYWMKDQKSCVVLTKQSHCSLFKVFAPELKYVFFDIHKHNLIFSKERTYRGIKFVPVMDAHWLENILSDPKKQFYKAYAQYFNLPKNIQFKDSHFDPVVQKEVIQKAKKLKLDLNNFVFISAEAISQEPLSTSVWQNLIDQLKIRGFDVFLNNPENQPLNGVKTCFLSIEETLILAAKAQAMVMLRSGMADNLCSIKVPQHIIYTTHQRHGDLFQQYTLLQYPYAYQRGIFEYRLTQQTQENIFSKILTKIEKREGMHSGIH